jgi:hypothetical protein
MEEKKKGKGIAALIVSKMGPKEGESEGHEDADYEAGKDAAVEDLMRALDERDPEAFKEALTAFISHC